MTPRTPTDLARDGAGLLALAGLVLWGVKLVRVTRGIERAREFWSGPQGDPGGLLYVALGDSTAQGVGASRPDRGYVGLLAQRLRERTGTAVQVINLSSSGARIHDPTDRGHRVWADAFWSSIRKAPGSAANQPP
ncbi:SGNH/GDSL hydrolase family protein [Aquipuribacter sp. MA13-6]|uniref:SGNH/GDSL hydrolase family protein n=1 Tax=unclassified Aquipuribacter TaxID=2635084 RepID=UPI003EEA99EF